MLDLPRAGVCLLRIVPSLCALVFLATGCDPEGPGATGTVTIGENVKRDGFKVLRLRAIVRPHDAFATDAPMFPGAGTESLGTSIRIDAHQTRVDYELGEPLGTTPHHRWRLFAWLERGDPNDDFLSESAHPEPGAPYGEVDFSVDYCGAGVGDYCGHTGGVDLTIDKIAP